MISALKCYFDNEIEKLRIQTIERDIDTRQYIINKNAEINNEYVRLDRVINQYEKVIPIYGVNSFLWNPVFNRGTVHGDIISLFKAVIERVNTLEEKI